ncbi:GGDEF domain-containing protein [Pseudoteredinibacter isoporae]|uniref:diguanylate cyclase n=1 Tax=Pseudoteredinibacter isoporae TaxID=570281 RepID=A0A7X0MXC2_9GAMM|nr:GGDEF domain-containing protein [Pseudoteredinibacter isoporae]MBB6523576.1 diguanylate cyclase (GGDEF)-like protein [Pseudoteredinibacter isoporae]NHO89084.1 diguanylate cyclase [Pseudoteredinibacter isoporae]NIB22305.1 diguanylate cyclase [Pseudoteredinibacter isoporae]
MKNKKPPLNLIALLFCVFFAQLAVANCDHFLSNQRALESKAPQSSEPTPYQPAVIAPSCNNDQLRGRWRGIAGMLIPPNQIEQAAEAYRDKLSWYELPGYWSLESLGISNDDPQAYITLWTEVALLGDLASGERLALWPGRFQSALRMYVDNGRGEIVKTYDNLSVFVPESKQIIEQLPTERVKGRLLDGAYTQLPKLYPGARVIVQLYNEDYRTGGASQPPLLGNADQLYRSMMQRWSWHILFLGACLLVAIYSASQALFSKRRRPLYIFSVIMSLGAGIRLLVTGSLLAYFIPGLTVVSHFYFTWISFLGLLAIFIYGQPYVLPDLFEHRVKLKKLIYLLAILPLLILACIPFLGLHEFLLLGHGLRLLYIAVAMAYVVFLLYQAFRFPFKQWLTFVGIVMILISGTSDALYYRRNTDPYIELFAIAVFMFIAVQVMYVSWGYMRLLIRERGLSLRLQELNENLEQQVKSRTQDLQEANQRLALAATTDALTGLPNRRAFDEQVEQELQRAQRYGSEFCLAIVDADWFKSVNDRFGHDFGDLVLQQMGVFFIQRLRSTDFVARIGGEEFAVLLPASSIDAAEHLMNELCQSFKTIHFSEQADYQVSVSIGLAQWRFDESFTELYQRADRALYRAKQAGRGRVCLGEASDERDETEPV